MIKITSLRVIEEKLRQGVKEGRLVYCRDTPRLRRLVEMAASLELEVRFVKTDELNALAGQTSHRGLIAFLPEQKTNRQNHLTDLPASLDSSGALVLALAHISDPQNLGALLRSCDQFAVDLVIMPKNRSARANQTVNRVASGAADYVPQLVVVNMARALDKLKERGFWVYGAQARATPAFSANLKGKVALVLGSEGSGLSSWMEKNCDQLIGIPSRGRIDSFNVAQAGSILLYEIRRQQNFFNLRS